jgi:hypothetical protein
VGDAVYALEPDVKVRKLPEWAGALVYTPHFPNLCYLNTTSWAVMELAPERTREAVIQSVAELLDEDATDPQTAASVAEALDSLVAQHILRIEA